MSTNDDQQTIGRIQALSHVEPSDEATRRALDRVRAALLDQPRAEAARQKASRPKGTFLTARRTAIVSTAAACLVGVIVGAVLFQSWGNIALADVQEKLERVENVTLTVRGGGQPDTCRVITTRSGMMRADMSDGSVHVVNPKQGKSLMLKAQEKRAIVATYFPPRHKDLSADLYMNLLRKLRSIIREDPVKRLPKRQIDGKRAVGFLIALGEPAILRGMKASVWVDPHTRLPVRVELTPAQHFAAGKPVYGSTVVWEEIVFDTQIDDSLFDTTPPAGFRVDSSGLVQVEREPLPPLVLTPKVGIGAVRFGMSKEEVIRILGQPDMLVREKRGEPVHLERNLKDPALKDFQESTRALIRAWKASPDYLVGYDMLKYSSSGLWLCVDPDRGLLSIVVRTQLSSSGRVNDFVGKTTEGIALGAALEDIEEAYGQPKSLLPTEGGFGALFYPQLGLTFTLSDGKLSRIDAIPVQASSAPPMRQNERIPREPQTLRY